MIGFFLKTELILIGFGSLSPNRNPHGFSSLILSNINFTIDNNGIERNIPYIPQSEFPAITIIMEKKAFILTCEATIFDIII